MADEPTKIILGDTAISAVEGQSAPRFLRGSKDQPSRPLTNCENCGAPLTGHWCSQCGQPAIDYRRSFRHVFVDVLDSFLNWDSKFFATIGLLIAKPWRLTNDFLAGRRARYVHPLRLYLLASILFFFAVNYGAKSLHLKSGNISPKDRAELEADLKDESLPPIARASIEEALKRQSSAPGTTAAPNQQTSPAPATTPEDDSGPLIQMGSEKPSTPFEKWFETRAKEKIGEHGSKAELFVQTVISNLPYMMLCCIPLFALVLKILYIRGRILYIDHLVYALHIHSFAYMGIMLLGLITLGLNRAAPGAVAGSIVRIIWAVFAVQIFLSIRRVYRQGWFLSIFKFFVGGIVYLVVLFLALAATFLVTLMLP